MRKVLLISEDTVKTYSELNNNVWGKSLMPAILSAEDMGLQTVLGECLYTSILNKVEDGSITDSDNLAYKALLDGPIQDYLLYEVLCDLVPIVGTKVGNLGTVVSNDQYVVNLSQGERELVANRYKYKADFYKARLQNYLLKYKDEFEELDECACEGIKANLKSSTSCSLWTGGPRNPEHKRTPRNN